MPDNQSLSSSVEPQTSESLNCDKAAQCETNLREPEEHLEDAASSPQMNVVVKEEEEEEPLCSMYTYVFKKIWMSSVVILTTLLICVFFVFSSVEDALAQVSHSEDFTIPEETLEQHQERNKEIRITVKEEEEEVVNSK